jgi:peptide/nickel transport system permease protein
MPTVITWRTVLSRAGQHPLLHSLIQATALLLAVTTLLFFLLRLAGDPAILLAGADATPEQVAAIRTANGLDAPLPMQFLMYLANALTLDFGDSLATGRRAMAEALTALGPTVMLAALAIGCALAIAIPIGAWIGAGPVRGLRAIASMVLAALQGVPGYVAALLLIQVFSIEWRLLPSIGFAGPQTWILPVATLAMFLAPKLAAVIAANMREAMDSDYVRTARAIGASETEAALGHALPNALVGAVALTGAQAAFLLSGAVVTESIFGWPGLGALLVEAAQTLDFPVIQAIAIVVAALVFSINLIADALARRLDPRLGAV